MTEANVNPSGMPQPLGRAIARCINAPVFAQQIVQEAEFFAQQGNHAAVAATLAQAGEYLDEDIAIQALEELQDSPEPRPWESGPFSVSLALQNARGARERLAQTRERHQESLQRAGNPGPDERPVHLFYAACSLTMAHAGTLHAHLERLEDPATGPDEAPGPRRGRPDMLRLHETRQRSGRAAASLRDRPETPRPEPRPQSRRRRMRRTGIRGRRPAIRRVSPVILHHNVAQDTELSQRARTLAGDLVQSGENFALNSGPSPFQPETCLTAMYFANSVYVKSLTDEYPDFMDSGTARAHAGVIRHFAEHFEHQFPDQKTGQLLRDAADHLQRLCNAELHDVSPHAIRDFIERTAGASGEPDTVRKAAWPSPAGTPGWPNGTPPESGACPRPQPQNRPKPCWTPPGRPE